MNALWVTHSAAARRAGMVCAVLLVTACAGTPDAPPGAAAARAELTRLQSDPQLATRAPQALQEAETAVTAAERPERDEAKAAHRVFMAEREVALARALATARLAEDERKQLAQQRDEARLRARTQEAVAARDEATMAQQQTAELQREVAVLRARPTDQGLVLTLGDVLFATGRADLKPGAVGDIDRLATFLKKYPERTVVVAGHTDDVGSAGSNMVLSRNRAESVRSYLTQQGIDPGRIEAKGMGESVPIVPNDTPGGRQQNRRVEIIVSNN